MRQASKQLLDEEVIIDDRYCPSSLDQVSAELHGELAIWESSRLDTGQFLNALQVEQRKLARTSEHYRQIGQALSIAETGCWKVGIVKLFPTKRIQALRELYKGPIHTFLRESLSTIPTTTLEFYVEDLDNLTGEASTLENLSVGQVTLIERLGFLVSLAPAIFIISSLVLKSKMHFNGDAEWMLLALPILPTLLYLGLVYVLISETYRRASFSIALGWEILRRKGGDTPGASPLQICPT
jgi:hypothetical protein